MSKKVDLNKLSPQELLAYTQNLVKQEKSKPPPKPVKIKLSKKLSDILSSSGKVLNYPKKLVSIAEMREEELRAILQESEARLEMKIFNPPSIFVWR